MASAYARSRAMPQPLMSKRERAAFSQAKAWYSWLTLLVAHWPADTQRRGAKRKRSSGLPLPAGHSVGNADHAPAAISVPAAKSAPKSSSASGEIRFGKGHRIFRSGAMHWCYTCGAYAEVRLKSLRAPCQGEAGTGPRAGQLARLRKGLHPLKPRERMPPPVRVAGCNAMTARGSWLPCVACAFLEWMFALNTR